MTANDLMKAFSNLTPEERDLPMLIDEDLGAYLAEDIRSVVIEQHSSDIKVVCVSACCAKATSFTGGNVVRVVWEYD